MYAAAHHNELRAPHTEDPNSVIEGRYLITEFIFKWIK